MRKRYRLLSKKGEGTFSEVLKAQCLATQQLVALKCMKDQFSSIEEVNKLREIQALRRLTPHEHIINLYEVVFEKKSGRLTLVFELMEMNLYIFIRKTNGYVPGNTVLLFMRQILRAIDHMHKRGIFHRDIKPENILISGNKLKLADFGSCRGKYSKQPFTEYISTRWYRAPECLLTDGYYDSKMDIWGVGCVFFEIMAMFPLFPGTNELDQIERIHRVLGTPSSKLLQHFKKRSSHIRFDFKPTKGTGIQTLIPHVQNDAISLCNQLLTYEPKRRIAAHQALKHRYFDQVFEIEYELDHEQKKTVSKKEKKLPPKHGKSGMLRSLSMSMEKKKTTPSMKIEGTNTNPTQMSQHEAVAKASMCSKYDMNHQEKRDRKKPIIAHVEKTSKVNGIRHHHRDNLKKKKHSRTHGQLSQINRVKLRLPRSQNTIAPQSQTKKKKPMYSTTKAKSNTLLPSVTSVKLAPVSTYLSKLPALARKVR